MFVMVRYFSDRLLGDNMVPSFPSGHIFGSTALFGFSTYLAVHHGLRKRVLVPLILLFAVILLAVGPARVHEQAHWPSDVAAGYLLEPSGFLSSSPPLST